jgi:ABC-type phosphate transport system substrate-binding protein
MLASVAIGCSGIADSANAQYIYAGGATFPSPVYRQLFDCFYVPIDGNPPAGGPTGFLPQYPINPNCSSPSGNRSNHNFTWITYAPVGSGAGKRALVHHDGSSSTTTGLGTPAASNTIPYVSSVDPNYGYASFQFAGSDDVWNSADQASYVAAGGPAKYGNILQLPSLAGAVVIAFNGNDGNGSPLNINNPVPAGATADKAAFGYPGNYSGLNLTRHAVCGIFTGHITRWDNPELTAANGGVALGTGQITVVHRSDGSGTNFIFTNALYRQCQDQFGPNNETDSTVRSWQFRFSDRVTTACPDQLFRASNTINWPDLVTDSCTPGNPIPNPGGGVFSGQNGNSSVKTFIQSHNGAIGYTTTDFTQPVLPAPAPQVANVQSEYDLDAGTGAFQWPSPNTVTNSMAAANPIFPDDAARANTLLWSAQVQVPNPATPNSYPIAGFTYLDLYQCYNSSRQGGATMNNIYFFMDWLNWGFGGSQNDQGVNEAVAILNSQGFAQVPLAWRQQEGQLMSGPFGLGAAGDTGGPCRAVAVNDGA